jgi:hypothetical protein
VHSPVQAWAVYVSRCHHRERFSEPWFAKSQSQTVLWL